jgi:hypothetical protein
MNTTILKKCLDELSKDSPKLDYVRGMLETLIEIQNPILTIPSLVIPKNIVPGMVHTVPENQDEATLLDAKARAALETIKSMNTEA